MKRLSLFLALPVILSVVLSACGGGAQTQAPAAPTQPPAAEAPAPTEAPPTPKVLKIANTANITTWDPVESFSTEAAYMANVYEQLLRINPPGSAEKFTPLLAERWESNADGTVWTFHLRKDVKFHDGEPLTAEAVKKSIEAAKERGGASFIWWMVESIEAVDDLTVQFNLSASAPLDLVASSLYGAWIVSPKALDAAAADENYWALKDISNGICNSGIAHPAGHDGIRNQQGAGTRRFAVLQRQFRQYPCRDWQTARKRLG